MARLLFAVLPKKVLPDAVLAQPRLHDRLPMRKLEADPGVATFVVTLALFTCTNRNLLSSLASRSKARKTPGPRAVAG